ncbi:MAG: ATP-binding cassette domain-containing protein [Thermodesulfovibrio sp.]|uniref:ABC transporter ATP-binding protein n=1 Tax=unclassified Thermodesulfovibrio TaxID=2645936 RepID=UPI00083AE0D9|nr:MULTISPECIES: ATP-binding cassette domain-containing protein [unclassified Thermodesulfovibrio]MDI1471991.1 ATP-binding cassette domain-containing protein [Thermodesulfovibrio sp. 1176]MDI6715216.1 ATP-binding cassette domain-containing protein [Thermodesulfovibrio sp.]ODA45252.1 ABC transporter, ATP-binding protein [Thermodesulfovibrio sp. N1]
MIVFDNVWFSYGDREVLKGISFTANFDERIAVLGESGGGKTTILKLILGLISPDKGKIIIDGVDITQLNEEELIPIRRKFSIVFQEGALFDSLPVKENVAFFMRELLKLPDEEIYRRVRELLRRVGVEDAEELMPEELSGGMHRRVAIARALAVGKTKMFLYDEPTAGLDPINSERIMTLIKDLADKENIGFMIITHVVYVAWQLCNRFIFLKEGQIVFDGNKDELIKSNISAVKDFIKELFFRI